jgi:GH15 family glucan-1,4-alpha-glucosidase
MGHMDEVHSYFSWLRGIIERDSAESLQPFYTLDGGRVIPEREPPYVSGHTAPRQFQLDIYGHVMLAVSEYYKLFGVLPDELWLKLTEIADYVCQAWKRPDYGPWGLTHKPEHFVVSKLFCWAALDQVCWLAKESKKPSSPRWLGEKNILHRTITEQGFDVEKNSFIRSFGGREIDSSVLWIPFLNFLSVDDHRVHGTLDAVQSQLSEGVLIKRYRNLYEIQNEEPLDLWSSFFFISCLALSGRAQEASDRLAELCTYASPLGLFGDQINPFHEEMPRNFPSSSVHLAMINAALYVGAARGRRKPITFLIGTEPVPLQQHRKSAS